MACLLALELDDEVLDTLRASARRWNIAVEDVDGLRLLDERPDEVAAVLVGSVSEPLRVAQHAHKTAPDIPLLLIRAPDDCGALIERLQVTPFVSADTRCVASRPLPEVVDAVDHALDRARRRRRFSRAIGTLNRKLEQGGGTGRAAAGILGRLLEVAPIGVVVTGLDLDIREINPRGAALFQEPEADLVGRLLPAAFSPQDAARVASLFRRLDEAPESRATEVCAAGPDGNTRIEVTAAPLPGNASGPGYLVILQDVTERLRLVEQLQLADRRKDEFLAMLGHELRNPLMPILTALQLMRMRQNDVFQKERAILERQATHLLRLVEDLMDVSRITRGAVELKLRPVQLYDVVARAVETASPLLEQRQHELELRVPTTGLLLNADEDRLVQVVSNLLSNAAKYTPPQGRIEVEARRVNDDVELVVRDTGMGISPELLPVVFDLFVQSERTIARSEGGLGLGLAIVKNLVQLHGGSVSAESEGRGKGSTFTIRLPAAEPSAALPGGAGSQATAARTASEQARVLVVDDNEDAAEALADVLLESGYEVRVAHDGPEALALVPGFAPEVALLDIGLPVMDGYELAGRLRARLGQAVTLIAVTGYGQPSDVERAHQAGFDHHFTKPVDFTRLLSLLEQVAVAR